MQSDAQYTVVDVHPEDSTGPLRLAIYHPHHRRYLEILSSEMPTTVVDQPLEEIGSTVDGVLCWKIPDEVLDLLVGLRWIQTTSAGVDHLLPYLTRRGDDILLSTVKGMNAEQVAGFALLMMLSLQWKLPSFLERQQRHHWQLHAALPLRGSTCAVIGLGNIGTLVALHAQHLGLHVLGMRRSATPVAGVDELFDQSRLSQMLGRADYVVVTAPLTDETRGLIGRDELAAMKPSAVLVNVGRGGVVDEAAVAAALESGGLAGASLDVFPEEPLGADDPLWSVPNLIITPHVAGERTDNNEAVAAIWMANIRRLAVGQEPAPRATFLE